MSAISCFLAIILEYDGFAGLETVKTAPGSVCEGVVIIGTKVVLSGPTLRITLKEVLLEANLALTACEALVSDWLAVSISPFAGPIFPRSVGRVTVTMVLSAVLCVPMFAICAAAVPSKVGLPALTVATRR